MGKLDSIQELKEAQEWRLRSMADDISPEITVVNGKPHGDLLEWSNCLTRAMSVVNIASAFASKHDYVANFELHGAIRQRTVRRPAKPLS